MNDWPAYLRSRIFTSWGTVLYVDSATGQLRHGPITSSPENAYFVADRDVWKSRPTGFIAHIEGDSFRPAARLADQHMSTSAADKADPSTQKTALDIVGLERGLVGLEADGAFLSAEVDGQITLSKSWCNTWEFFLLSEDWCSQLNVDSHAAKRHFNINRGMLQSFIVDPRLRAAARKNTKAKKLLIYGYTQWSHGRVYYDLCKHLHARGYIVDILDWRIDHAAYVGEVLPYYDLYMTALDGVRTLVDSYGAPYGKIIGLSHHELDMRMLIEQKGMEVFDKFANYGVVSEFLYSASQMTGIPRVPKVASLGVNFFEFYAAVPEKLGTVGYASSMSTKTYGVEWKRGDLAEAATQDAGLEFKVAGSTENQISFHDMPEFYRSVDAVVISSISESGPLTVTEAAAAGRLVIGTPVGHFPRRAYQGGGILAPVEADKFKTFTTETLKHYKDNPGDFVEKCRSIQEAARQLDWQYTIDEWVDLIESAKVGSASVATPAPQTDSPHAQLMRALWRAKDPYRDLPPDAGAVDLQGWSSSHEYLTHSIATRKPTVIVEVGVWKGASTVTMAKKMRECEIDGAIIAVDTWLGSWDHWNDERWFAELFLKSARPQLFHTFIRNVLEEKVHDLVVPLPLDSSNAFNVLKSRNIEVDMIHIDGAHDYDSVLFDLTHWWSILRSGGTLIADDYYDSGMWPAVRKAVDEFLSGVPHSMFEYRDGKCRVIKL